MKNRNALELPPVDNAVDISVVIVSYNTKEMTLECVQSLIDHSKDVKLQIIVVDNCSSDGSAEALRKAHPQITVVDSPANGGFAFGNNIGFEQTKGKYVLLLNPDTRVHEGGLKTALMHMESHPDVGIMGPRVLLDDGSQQSSMIRFLSLTQLFFIIFIPSLWLRSTTWFGDLRYAGLSRDTINDVDAVSGCFMLARREVLERIGGLDERFFMYGEESEWCWRVRKPGWAIRYNPDVEILHHGAASTAHMSEWKAVEMAKGHILFLRFTRGSFIAWTGAMLELIRDIVRMPYYGGRALFHGFRLLGPAKPWWARLKFLAAAVFSLPKGQQTDRPAPDVIRSMHIK